PMNRRHFLTPAAGAAAVPFLGLGCGDPNRRQLLTASYDATREVYRNLNRRFTDTVAALGQPPVRVTPSYGGSGSQARAVIDGLPADVLALALWPDTDAVRKQGLINDGKPGWEDRFPNRSCPYTSTIVFVVRAGNPCGIRDWDDLATKSRPDGGPLRIVAANPKTSGAAKLGVIACWGSVTTRGGSEADAEKLVTAVYRRVPALETSSRAASVTFARKMVGDVQITWENEAWLEHRELDGGVEVVYPTRSLLAEPHVAVVDKVAAEKGNTELATAFIEFLYTPAAQAVIAENFFRPSDPAALAKHADRFPPLERFPVGAAVSATTPGQNGWDAAQARFFADGALFDRIF
ncbi:MAG: sulfate ABC transporter substrate-binding protein, partial [Fimbriiglobus sp.]